jgi:hypothetical protein
MVFRVLGDSVVAPDTGGEGGSGIATGSVSSGITVSSEDAADAGRATLRGDVGVRRTVLAEVDIVDELRNEEKDGMCRSRRPRDHFTSGALTSTGVRRGR